MSAAIMILGESGTGKSTSMRNLDPHETLLIQTIKKPLPFRSKNWSYLSNENASGNMIICDNSEKIISLMRKTKRPVIVLDDFQYLLANEFMRRTEERGYDKFTDIGKHAWEVLTAASTLPDRVRVYILAHTETSDSGRIKAKTIGRMLDEKITIEGMFSIVMRTAVINDQFVFSTKNSGMDTVKTPMGMFEADHIDNDLAAIDASIVDYYDLKAAA